MIKYQIDATKLLPMTSQRDVIFKKMITQTHIYIHKQKESNNSADENEMNSDLLKFPTRLFSEKGGRRNHFEFDRQFFCKMPRDLATCNTKHIGVSLLMH